ncbi:hypothetical protein BDF14DRAFT_1766709 [Spinellus fusiger]|nr:hypothetical protein BDF14DRAFT_1766709 [Spinellus fusiger]
MIEEAEASLQSTFGMEPSLSLRSSYSDPSIPPQPLKDSRMEIEEVYIDSAEQYLASEGRLALAMEQLLETVQALSIAHENDNEAHTPPVFSVLPWSPTLFPLSTFTLSNLPNSISYVLTSLQQAKQTPYHPHSPRPISKTQAKTQAKTRVKTKTRAISVVQSLTMAKTSSISPFYTLPIFPRMFLFTILRIHYTSPYLKYRVKQIYLRSHPSRRRHLYRWWHQWTAFFTFYLYCLRLKQTKPSH